MIAVVDAIKRAWERLGCSNRIPHDWNGLYCMDKHYSPHGYQLPPCRWCKHCGLVPYPYTQRCNGPKEDPHAE